MAEIAKHCPADTHIIRYSRPALECFGHDFDLHAAPSTQAETDNLLREFGPDSKVYFWVD